MCQFHLLNVFSIIILHSTTLASVFPNLILQCRGFSILQVCEIQNKNITDHAYQQIAIVVTFRPNGGRTPLRVLNSEKFSHYIAFSPVQASGLHI